MNILILMVYVAIWGITHSLQASTAFKDFLRRMFGPNLNRFYRFMYNVLSVIGFVPLLVLTRILPDQDVYVVTATWRFLMFAGQGIALLLLLVTFLQTDALSFIGLRQMIEEEKQATLITSGFYRFVRHPLYLFGLLFLWLTPVMTVNSLVVYISLTIYLIVGAYFEERKLSREFGARYVEYKSHTPMIVPGLIIKRN